MSATLIDSVRSAFTADVQTKVSALLGETEGNTHKAVDAAVPLVLTDILHDSSFSEPTARIADLSTRAAAGDFFGELHELTINPGGLVPGSVLLNKGTEYARALLLTRYDPAVAEISRYAGISLPSASFVIGIVSFASLDAIGRHLAQYNLAQYTQYNADGRGLPDWIRTHGEGIRAAMPAGLEVKRALGIPHYPWERPARRSRSSTMAIVLVLIVLIAAILGFYEYRKDHPSNAFIGTDTMAPAGPTAPAGDTIHPDTARVR